MRSQAGSFNSGYNQVNPTQNFQQFPMQGNRQPQGASQGPGQAFGYNSYQVHPQLPPSQQVTMNSYLN
jgi:hypothetical protein